MIPLLCLLAAPTAFPAPLITIDDGPNRRHHWQTLRLLRRHHVKAIWFVNGHFLWDPRNRKLLRKIVADGHQLGNHLLTHRSPCHMTVPQFRRELRRTEQWVNRSMHWPKQHRMRWYRPPFGHRCHAQLARRLGYRVVYWNRADIGSTGQQMIRTVLHRWHYHTPRRSILLFHYYNQKLLMILRRFFPEKKERQSKLPAVK